MMTMTEIRAKKYDVNVLGTDTETQKQNKSAIKYIEHLSSLTNIDISNLRPLDVLVDESGKLPRERNKINEVFFSWVERTKADAKKPIIADANDEEIQKLAAILNRAFSKSIDRLIANNRKSCQDENVRLDAAAKQILKHQVNISRFNIEGEALEKKKITGIGLETEIKTILSHGWWSLSDSPANNAVSFVSPEIILSHNNQKAAIESVVNCGRVQVNLRLNGDGALYVSAEKYDKNPIYGNNGYYHPHINSNGTFCFGNVGTEVGLALANFNIIQAFELVKSVLITYNSGNPYVHLHDLEVSFREGRIFSRENHLKADKAIRAFFSENRFFAPVESTPETQIEEMAVSSEVDDDEENDDEDYAVEAEEGPF